MFYVPVAIFYLPTQSNEEISSLPSNFSNSEQTHVYLWGLQHTLPHNQNYIPRKHKNDSSNSYIPKYSHFSRKIWINIPKLIITCPQIYQKMSPNLNRRFPNVLRRHSGSLYEARWEARVQDAGWIVQFLNVK
jgi:hypothetical protein